MSKMAHYMTTRGSSASVHSNYWLVGEVIAQKWFGYHLYTQSWKGHDMYHNSATPPLAWTGDNSYIESPIVVDRSCRILHSGGLRSCTLDAKRRDSMISSAVYNVEWLTIAIILLLTAVDCSWYFFADGTVFQRPIRRIVEVSTFAALAIVGDDIRIDWILN